MPFVGVVAPSNVPSDASDVPPAIGGAHWNRYFFSYDSALSSAKVSFVGERPTVFLVLVRYVGNDLPLNVFELEGSFVSEGC